MDGNCTLAHEVTRAVAPIFVYLVIVNFCVFVSLLYAGSNIINNTFFHIHLRILLMNVIVAMLFRTAFTTFRALIRLTLLVQAQSPCDFMEEFSFCTAISSITLPAMKVVTMTYVLITCERIASLLLIETYEQRRNVLLVSILAALTWYGLPPTLHSTWRGFIFGDSGRRIPYCSSSSSRVVTYWYIFEWTIPANFLNLLALIILQILLKKRTKLSLWSTPMLSSRYEIRSSLKSLKFILPNVFICCGVSCVLMTISILVIFIRIRTLRDAALMKEWTSALIIPTQYLSFPIICYIRAAEMGNADFSEKRRRETNHLLQIEKMDPGKAMENIQNIWEMHQLKK